LLELDEDREFEALPVAPLIPEAWTLLEFNGDGHLGRVSAVPPVTPEAWILLVLGVALPTDVDPLTAAEALLLGIVGGL